MESSQTRDQTSVPCTGRQILNHWTTRKALTPNCCWYSIGSNWSDDQVCRRRRQENRDCWVTQCLVKRWRMVLPGKRRQLALCPLFCFASLLFCFQPSAFPVRLIFESTSLGSMGCALLVGTPSLSSFCLNPVHFSTQAMWLSPNLSLSFYFFVNYIKNNSFLLNSCFPYWVFLQPLICWPSLLNIFFPSFIWYHDLMFSTFI